MQAPFVIDWNALATGAAGGLIVFVITLISEFFVRKYEKHQDKSEQQIVRFKNETRRVTGSIFSYLAPGATIEMMKSDLGPPNREYYTEAGIYSKETLCYAFDDEPDYSKRYIAYLYFSKMDRLRLSLKTGRLSLL